jgi:hypothetical protein
LHNRIRLKRPLVQLNLKRMRAVALGASASIALVVLTIKALR